MEFEKDLNLLKEFPPPSMEEWKKVVEESLKGADFNKVMFTKTYEGITLKPIYTKEDTLGLPFMGSYPGAVPYLRGNSPNRLMDGGWLVAQIQDGTSAEAVNAQLLKELQLGLTAVNIKLSHDDDQRGVNINSIDDLRTLLMGIDLKAAPLFMQLDVKENHILNWFEQYAGQKNIDLSTLEAGIGFDPTGEYIRKGYVDYPLEDVWQKTVDAVKWGVEKAPRNRILSIDATIYGAAGASSVQELGFALSTAIGIIQGLQYSGFEIDQLAPLFQIKLSLGSNFFMEIAKIRALRLVWAEMIGAFGGNETSQKIWIHGKTASFNKSIYDTYVNVLRTGTEGFSGVIGGVDSLEIDCFDELVNTPDEFSRRIARNQQIILREEAHFGKVIDPAGGCYYIENLTNELANKAWSLMQEIEGSGGMVRSVRAGRIHEMIAVVAQSRIDAVDKRRSVFVGVNMFANPEEKTVCCRAEQSARQVTRHVELDKGPLPRLRVVQKLEHLRSKIESSARNTRIFLLNMGPLAEHKARADFSLGFFQTGGFEVLNPHGFNTAIEAAQATRASGAAAFCICSTDENYHTLVPELCELLKGETLILAGYPADMAETYKAQGIKLFIHLKADVYDTLLELADLMGVER